MNRLSLPSPQRASRAKTPQWRSVVFGTIALMLATVLLAPGAGAIVAQPDYSSNPGSVVNCSQQAGTTTCFINAPIDSSSNVTITIGGATASLVATGGAQNFAVVGATGTPATVTFVVSGVTYTATVIVHTIVVPTPTPAATPQPTTVPATVTPIDYGFGNGIPTRPAPLAITGNNSRYLIAGGLALVLGGVLLMTRRPDYDETHHDHG